MSARRPSVRRTTTALAAFVVSLLLACAAVGTASPEPSASGDHDAVVALHQHDGQPQEVLAPRTHTDRSTRAGAQRLLVPFALFSLFVALWQRRTRLLAIAWRIGWRAPRPVRHRGPPLFPVAP